MRMTSDLEGLDRTAEIMPDGGSGIDKELSRILKGFGIHLTTTVEEECIHGVIEETNRRSMLPPFRGGQVATP